jgi:hypothetical protein
MLKVITTSRKEFEIIFRRAWKIKATMTSVSWMENNRQKPNESIAAFVTSVQNAVATTSREALTNNANDIKEKDEPKWNDHTEKYLAAQAVYNARAVATPWIAGREGSNQGTQQGIRTRAAGGREVQMQTHHDERHHV